MAAGTGSFQEGESPRVRRLRTGGFLAAGTGSPQKGEYPRVRRLRIPDARLIKQGATVSLEELGSDA